MWDMILTRSWTERNGRGLAQQVLGVSAVSYKSKQGQNLEYAALERATPFSTFLS
jgi:hypothetical protein